MRKRLVELYRENVANMTPSEAKEWRRLWHDTAKRYLALQSITSDVVKEPQPDANGIITVPIDAKGIRFFLARDIDELVELYRATKPRKAV